MVERREFCYDFIEFNSCKNTGKCRFAHVIIKEEEKAGFLLKNPRSESGQTSNFTELLSKNTKSVIGGSIISKCLSCGKGILNKAKDHLENNISASYCVVCIKAL